MRWNSQTMTVEPAERVATNCFACGRPVDQIRKFPNHTPDPTNDADRCASRPRKYDHLRCMYAAGHDCAHTAHVVGTGRHYWREVDGVQPATERKHL
jgi:hypothetical protein